MDEKYYLVEVTETCQRSFAVPVSAVSGPEEAIKMVASAAREGSIEVTFENMTERKVALNTSASEDGSVLEGKMYLTRLC